MLLDVGLNAAAGWQVQVGTGHAERLESHVTRGRANMVSLRKASGNTWEAKWGAEVIGSSIRSREGLGETYFFFRLVVFSGSALSRKVTEDYRTCDDADFDDGFRKS